MCGRPVGVWQLAASCEMHRDASGWFLARARRTIVLNPSLTSRNLGGSDACWHDLLGGGCGVGGKTCPAATCRLEPYQTAWLRGARRNARVAGQALDQQLALHQFVAAHSAQRGQNQHSQGSQKNISVERSREERRQLFRARQSRASPVQSPLLTP